MPIDIVIPHVDGSAQGYEALCRQWTGTWVPCHVRDLGELRFVLRSLETYAPWATRPIIVVQSEAHLPSWLDRTRVRVVLHSDYLPHELLPTFHWATIVSHFFRIAGLRSRYVIWEDDILAGRPVSPSDMYEGDGLPHFAYTSPIVPGLSRVLSNDAYQRNLSWTRYVLHTHARRLGRFLPPTCFLHPHAPLPVERASFETMFHALYTDPIVRDTVTRRHKSDGSARATVDPTVLYANWIDGIVRNTSSVSRYGACLREALSKAARAMLPSPLAHLSGGVSGTYPIVNRQELMNRNMRRFLRERPRFLNMNDDAYDSYEADDGTLVPPGDAPRQASLSLFHDAMRQRFPRPSRFETDRAIA